MAREKIRQRIYEIQSGHGHRDKQSNRVPDEYSRDDAESTLDDIPEPVPVENSPELEAILEALKHGGEKILSIRERQAFQLVVREGRSERVAAELMKCSRRAVQTHVRRAGMKLRKLCQPWL